MAVYKIVVRAFIFVGEAGKTACLTQSRKFFITACKKLVSIALVAYIPDYCIMRAVEYAMKRNSKFNNTKITGKMASVFSNYIDYSCTDFSSQLLKFFLRKLFNILRRMNLRK